MTVRGAILIMPRRGEGSDTWARGGPALASALVLVVALVEAGCARHGHGVREAELPQGTGPCEAQQPVVVRVLDSEVLEPSDPLAFRREAGIAWVVGLQVVEVVKGPEIGERLGVLVHSPSMFATDTWGFGASPQKDPATLELRWSKEQCLYEVKGVIQPEPAIGDTLVLEAPRVHSAILGGE